MERPTVLIVEDDPAMRKRIMRMLHSETSLAVIEADGLSTAAELLEDRHIHVDAVLCDLSFGPNAIDTARNLRSGLDLLQFAGDLRPKALLYVLSVNSDDQWERRRASQLKIKISGWFPKLAPSPSEIFWAQINSDLTPGAGRKRGGRSEAETFGQPYEFDVFLAHNTKDKRIIEKLSDQLKRRGIKPWFDKSNLAPGRVFQEEIERIIPKIRSIAILCGRSGIGPWERLEVRLAMSQFVRRNAPVIPVLLPGAKPIALPLMLHEFNWLSFKQSIDDKDALDRLIWGITGTKPDA